MQLLPHSKSVTEASDMGSSWCNQSNQSKADLLEHGRSAAGPETSPVTSELCSVQDENIGQGAQQSAGQEGTGKCSKQHIVHMASQ